MDTNFDLVIICSTTDRRSRSSASTSLCASRNASPLLVDLAAFKHMSLSSCLEETLLHALAGVGPHNKTDLRHIEKLKQKHGIDYDSHASYRFVER